MTVRAILQSPDPRLSVYSSAVVEFGAPLEQLVADMVDTMRDAGGVGLAAIQIGVPWQVFVVETEGFGYQTYVNPKALAFSKKLMGFDEGCLSLAGVPHECVIRPQTVEAVWQNVQGKRCVGRLTGMRARIFCHELDHLKGTLYPARARPGDFVVGGEPKELRQ